MTIEGRPYLGPDTTYAEQRKQRLQDCVDDYLQDDEVSPLLFYTKLEDCINEVIHYHGEQKTRAVDLMKLIRPLQIQQDIVGPDEC